MAFLGGLFLVSGVPYCKYISKKNFESSCINNYSASNYCAAGKKEKKSKIISSDKARIFVHFIVQPERQRKNKQ